LIKQNIKNKEKAKRDALREEETKLQRRKQMKQDYEAKLTQQRLESHRQASQEQFKHIKQQIEQTKKQSESIMATLEE